MATIGYVFSNVDRAVRSLRLQKRWTQGMLGDRIGVSRETISRLERGDLLGLTLSNIDRVAGALGATVHVQVRWHGEQLDRLLDAAHASLQQAAAESLAALGWTVRIEVSFNHYGDRGRIDILAFHPRLRILLIIEIKSALGDLQETLGRLDVKARLGRQIARDLGWTDVSTVIPALVIGDSRLARRTVASHEALFTRYAVRGRFAVAWLRRASEPMPGGLLWFAKRSDSRQATAARRLTVPKRSDSHVV